MPSSCWATANHVGKVFHAGFAITSFSVAQANGCWTAHITRASTGGQVITSIRSDAPHVVGLVYVAGFGLDEGESIGALLGQGPPTPAIQHLRLDAQGFAWLPESAFLQHFAPDVDPVEARVMCAVQQPLAYATLNDVMTTPAWKTLPTWFAVAQHDQVIPPDGERLFARRMGATTVEVDSSHVVMISHPDEVTALIQSAVDAA